MSTAPKSCPICDGSDLLETNSHADECPVRYYRLITKLMQVCTLKGGCCNTTLVKRIYDKIYTNFWQCSTCNQLWRICPGDEEGMTIATGYKGDLVCLSKKDLFHVHGPNKLYKLEDAAWSAVVKAINSQTVFENVN